MYKKAIILFVALLFLSGCTSELEESKVSRVIDGDTIELSTGEGVRLIGIDTPELNEPYYSEAKNRLQELIEDKLVVLESDFEDTDKYGRLLRYVFLDEENINIEMVEEGYAYAYVFSDIKYKEEIMAAENYAKDLRIGIWSL